MFIDKKLLKISSFLILFSASYLSLAAYPPPTDKDKTPSNPIAPKKVKIEQTSHNIQVTTANGDAVALPKVKKTLVEQRGELSPVRDLYADADLSNSLASLHERLIEKKEMEELSGRLGITITDAALLPLYREVTDWLGTRYRRGGMSRKAVDCSGFTNLIYKNVYDIQLDRVSTVIAKNIKHPVTKEDLEPGDMVFFSTFNKKYINHVGVYIGEGKFVHASIKKGVIVSTLAEGYYSKAWRKGGR
ncbi:C40 family peptidase [Dysgonomonas sp. 511]|uniref:C40 family peptidase n=1 Tax=Dysgonomonas sp. 511 TaxID=2302930 RepID=UPI0013D65B71|nr:C40 family peptidase [Dysgonomonas sp. 511]NDV79536.1 NlpC/P60 family protein [Dysgonomonas sp. 511]